MIEPENGDVSAMQIDPTFVKIWYAWVKWMDQLPYWDPYGAAAALIVCGFALGYFFWKVLHEE